MIRNLKALGLALVAVFAMSAVAASAASAGSITSPETFIKLTGTDVTKSVLHYNANQEVKCHGHYDIGEVNQTPHGLIHLPTSTLTVKPTYSACEAVLGGKVVGTATITMGNCDYVLHVGAALGGGVYGGTADLVCSSGDVTIDVYPSTDPKHEKAPACTYTFSAQTGLEGGEVSSEGTALHLGGNTKKIAASRTGIICGGAGSTTEAELSLNASANATNEEGEPETVSLSG